MKREANTNTVTNTTTNHSHNGCPSPRIGSKLPDYIVALLDEDLAFEVEQHLADCHYCKRRYLMVLRVLGSASLRGKTNPTKNSALSERLEDLEVNKLVDARGHGQ